MCVKRLSIKRSTNTLPLLELNQSTKSMKGVMNVQLHPPKKVIKEKALQNMYSLLLVLKRPSIPLLPNCKKMHNGTALQIFLCLLLRKDPCHPKKSL